MSVERFTITYDHVGYRVSIPNYRGGEVVRAADHDAEVDRLRLALRYVDEAYGPLVFNDPEVETIVRTALNA